MHLCVQVHAHADARRGHRLSCSFTLGFVPVRQGLSLSLELLKWPINPATLLSLYSPEEHAAARMGSQLFTWVLEI